MVHDTVQNRRALKQHLLVLRCQAGDEQAFARLYDRYHRDTFRYLTGLLDKQTAEDVQQVVWLTVYQKIATLSHPGRFKIWLYQITRNRAIDFLRKEQRQTELFAALDEDEGNASIQASDDKWLAGQSLDLETAMRTLSTAHREVLMLRFWEGMPYAEIALIVGCSIGTVRSRIHHAKLKLKNTLEQ